LIEVTTPEDQNEAQKAQIEELREIFQTMMGKEPAREQIQDAVTIVKNVVPSPREGSRCY